MKYKHFCSTCPHLTSVVIIIQRVDIYNIVMTWSSFNSTQYRKQNECAWHHLPLMHTSRGETRSQRISDRVKGTEWALVDAASVLAVTLLLLFPSEVVPKSRKIREDLAGTRTLNRLHHKLLCDSDHVV